MSFHGALANVTSQQFLILHDLSFMYRYSFLLRCSFLTANVSHAFFDSNVETCYEIMLISRRKIYPFSSLYVRF
jgi:hypothetical protein